MVFVVWLVNLVVIYYEPNQIVHFMVCLTMCHCWLNHWVKMSMPLVFRYETLVEEWVIIAQLPRIFLKSAFYCRKPVVDKKKYVYLFQELCSHVMVQLGKAGFPSEAFSVYNMLRYSKRTVRKYLHEKALGILVSAELLKDAYIVVKVLKFYCFSFCYYNLFCLFSVSPLRKSNWQDNADLISPSSLENFAKSFMVSGNINLINDVMKALNRSGWRISQVMVLCL